MRNAALVLAILLVNALPGAALAQPANQAEAQVAADSRMVQEYVDLGEYQVARDSLEKSLAQLKAAGSAVRPIAAETHAALGVVYVIGFKDSAKATEHFTTAINIQQDIALPTFATERAKVVFAKAYEAAHPTIKCDTLMGLFHQAVPLAQEGKDTAIEVKLDKHLVGSTMLVMYRGSAGGDFTEAPLTKAEDCTYRGMIPAASVNAPKVEYYLEARLKDGRPAARRGKSQEPYVVNVSFGPVADAEQSEPVEEPEEVVATAPSDEIEDLLLTKPKTGKGSGCAGCSTGSGSGGQGVALLLCALVLLGLRRRARA